MIYFHYTEKIPTFSNTRHAKVINSGQYGVDGPGFWFADTQQRHGVLDFSPGLGCSLPVLSLIRIIIQKWIFGKT